MELSTSTTTKAKPRRRVAKSTKAPARSRKANAAAKAASKLIVKALDKNKAEDITELDLKDKSSFADYMVVASGRSQRHVASLADYVVKALRTAKLTVLSVEGQETADWVLIDAGDVVVHIFRPEIRQFYNLEKMWAIPLTPGR